MDNHAFTIDIEDHIPPPRKSRPAPPPPCPAYSSADESSSTHPNNLTTSPTPPHQSHARYSPHPAHEPLTDPSTMTKSPSELQLNIPYTINPKSPSGSVAQRTYRYSPRNSVNPEVRRYLSLPDDIGFRPALTGKPGNVARNLATLARPWPEPFHNDDGIARLSSAPGSSVRCNCPCGRSETSKSKNVEEEGVKRDVSWRRLYMSRAKLKSTATTSELLAGFAMVAMVELQINDPTEVPEWLFVVFSLCTTVLVSVHVFALMISTYLIPSIDAISKMNVRGLVNESPHERMWNYIELAWTFSTVVGLFLFLVEIVVICWVKFWDFSFLAAWASTVVIIPVLILFIVFVTFFYNTLQEMRVSEVTMKMQQLEAMKEQLDHEADVNSSTV